MNDNDIVKDFLVESYENLDRLDRELVGLEKHPGDKNALASIFRTIHTIKGNCGFLGFSKLEKVAHVGESLLTLLRDGKLALNPEIVTGLLRMVDAIRQMLAQIGSTGQDGELEYPELVAALTQLQNPGGSGKAPSPKSAAPPPPSPASAQTPVPDAAATKPTAPEKVAPGAAAPPPPPPAPAVAAEAASTVHPVPADAAPAGEARRDTAAETIRVGVNLLDKLMTLVGELVLARNQLLQFSNTLEDTGLQTVSQRMNLIATELQEEVMKTRMQPIGNIWSQFPRTVRDVALNCHKEVSIEMEGKETELDKTIIEAIKDPLTHLVRNAVDHGIELPEIRVKAGKPAAGRLMLRAFHEGGQVNIEISDDGAGLNVQRIRQKAVERGLITSEQSARMPDRETFNLIFLPGFSTAEKVTNVSGRGVGMDVVKTNVEKIGGAVDVQSAAGQGTTVRVKIPLTLAIIPALVVTCAGDRYAIPQVNLVELVRLEADQLKTGIELVHGAPVHRLRGRLLPLVYLARELRVDGKARKGSKEADEAVNIVVLQADARQFGLVVDAINDTEEIVVKPLRKQLKSIKTFAGASIMGDGKIALILDVMGVAQRSGVVGETRDRALDEAIAASAVATGKEKQTFLLFHGPDQARMAVPLDTLARLEELPASQIERAGTQLVAQYRGRILPLVQLASLVEERRQERRHPEPEGGSRETGPLQVLVCNHEGHRVGLVVERIVDIVEDAAEVRYPPSRQGILCSTVIQEKVTELIDVPAILKSAKVRFDVEPAEVSH
ncbi:MAG TPA: chemotaxis protein CheW [Candidatus Acidoferrales bacterium]|jgi:two-component system chemotaxis sensor kinase CheA|nr:chemotaxis protein CheW [Candidatus Acidoferrales bacterium]